MEPQTHNHDENADSAFSQPVDSAMTSENRQQSATETSSDAYSQYRTFAILGYILPFLFFLPLLDDKTKTVPYVRFHANQQLILLVIVVAVSILHNFLFGMMLSLGYLVYQVLNLAILALAVTGIYHAYKDQMKELPFVGQFTILK